MLKHLDKNTACWNCSSKDFKTDPNYPSSIGVETNRHTCCACGKHWQTLKDEFKAHSFVAPWASNQFEENAKRYVGEGKK